MMAEENDVLCPPVLVERGFSINELIFSGSFSICYKASWTQLPNKELFVKIVQLEEEKEFWAERCLKRNLKILMNLNHPNIVKIYHLVKTAKTTFIFMDYVTNGDIEKFMRKIYKPLEETKAKLWFRDMINAVNYIHSKGIANRGLCLSNFLIDSNDRVLLTDFNFSCIAISKYDYSIGFVNCGTPNYLGPELYPRIIQIPRKPYDAKASDMYGLGVCLFFMINNSLPFGLNDTHPEYINRQVNRDLKYSPQIEQNLSETVKDLIFKLLEPKPHKRILSKNVLSHSWLK